MPERTKKLRTLGRANRLIRHVVRRREPERASYSKFVPIGISVLALGISCLSWWESHQGRRISEEINRPVLEYVKTDSHVYPVVNTNEVNVFFDAKIKNAGKSRASSIHTLFGRIKLISEDAACKQLAAPEEALLHINTNGDLLPGTEGTFYASTLVSSGCKEMEIIKFYFFVVITYQDMSGRQDAQELTGVITASPTELSNNKEGS